jgi:hypothetical protein
MTCEKTGSDTQLPFDYDDVADEVVTHRAKWGVAVILYNVKTKHLFAVPSEMRISDPWVVELFRWSFSDEDDLTSEDLKLSGKDSLYDDFYENVPRHWDTFREYLEDAGEYDNRVQIYLVKQMQRENLAAKWLVLIQHVNKTRKA